MSIDLKSISVGQCYLTRSGFVRRVVSVAEGQAKADHRRGPIPEKGRPRPRTIVLPLAQFTSTIVRAVPCDWMSEAEEVCACCLRASRRGGATSRTVEPTRRSGR